MGLMTKESKEKLGYVKPDVTPMDKDSRASGQCAAGINDADSCVGGAYAGLTCAAGAGANVPVDLFPIGLVGEKKNYNLQPGVTEYELWSASTIEWVPDQNKYKARAIIKHKTTDDNVVINSWHEDYADAERAIDVIINSLSGVGERRLYNVFGETIEIHASHHAGSVVNVIEVQGLIWSFLRYPSP